jgi:hypothetical protein
MLPLRPFDSLLAQSSPSIDCVRTWRRQHFFCEHQEPIDLDVRIIVASALISHQQCALREDRTMEYLGTIRSIRLPVKRPLHRMQHV